MDEAPPGDPNEGVVFDWMLGWVILWWRYDHDSGVLDLLQIQLVSRLED
jgi:hypothetical protein